MVEMPKHMEQRVLDLLPRYYSPYEMPVSVIVPAYNEETTIAASIRSMLQLDYPEFEVIAVNDGSRDGTLQALVREFALVLYPEAYRQRIAVQKVRSGPLAFGSPLIEGSVVIVPLAMSRMRATSSSPVQRTAPPPTSVRTQLTQGRDTRRRLPFKASISSSPRGVGATTYRSPSLISGDASARTPVSRSRGRSAASAEAASRSTATRASARRIGRRNAGCAGKLRGSDMERASVQFGLT